MKIYSHQSAFYLRRKTIEFISFICIFANSQRGHLKSDYNARAKFSHQYEKHNRKFKF